ncbi:MAG TPA: hypothetical protein VGX91_09950 [Candidatus Cybelea sp.]|jgi:hypothetical protein|nr:hypothetical protein [Candidatus Cybelea sp.]
MSRFCAIRRNGGGIWSSLNVFFDPKPQVFTRLRKLHDGGYRYPPRETEAT